MTDDPRLKSLAALLGAPQTEAEREKRRVRNEACRRAKSCGNCGNALVETDTVWRRRISVGAGFSGIVRYNIVPVCAACAGNADSYLTAQPCEGCKRPVRVRWDMRSRTRTFCCDACRAKDQQTIAKQRRAMSRDQRTCRACGIGFSPARSDAAFCSAACRQRGYRCRVTDTK